MLSRIFIDRPILAWVLAIIAMLAGIGAIFSLPIAQYPDVAPTNVSIRASYPGASAETVQNSVTQVIEQTLTGVDGLLYFSSSSGSDGSVRINATFDKGINPDLAQVQVQNQLQQVIARLPQQVQQSGITVRKSNPDMLLIVGVYDKTDKMSPADISDYMSSNVEDPLARVQGVGNTFVFGSPHAMRIWLDPNKLLSYQLMPGDIISAIQAQNTEVAAGSLGAAPSAPDQYLNVIVTAQSRLKTPEEFRNIIVKTSADGATVHLSDVARVELGSETYGENIHVNSHNGTGMAVMLAPGADALTTATLVKAEVVKLAKNFPPGLTYAFVNDSTNFIKLSIWEVGKTLVEAIVLVVLVMFLFLQNWRATLIPTIAVPVVILGTFAILYILGYSINTLTLFALVLSIGLLVDDAIVVVENVQRLMEEHPDMSAREATLESMREITMALIAIALVLSAVFLPMAFFGGSIGVIYRQFAVTIVSAMVLSVLVAIVLTPALTSNLLRRHPQPDGSDPEQRPRWMERRMSGVTTAFSRFGEGFNRRFHSGVERYLGVVDKMVTRRNRSLFIYVLIVLLLAFMFHRLPGGFLPNEDQSIAIVSFQLPSGATVNRTDQVQHAVEHYFNTYEKNNIQTMLAVSGTGGPGSPGGQNVGRGFLLLKPSNERPGAQNSASAITQRATRALSKLRDAQVFALVPPPIRGFGDTSGFEAQLLNSGNMTPEAFAAAKDKLLSIANTDPVLAAVRLSELPDVTALKVDIDQQKLAALGLTQSAVDTTLSVAWGGRYINDFIDNGRVKRVYIQADAPFRSQPSDLDDWYVRGDNGQMTPFSAFSHFNWSKTPSSLSRFDGVPSYEVSGQAAPGYSSGDAMNEIQKLAAQIPGTSMAFSGLSYQERISEGQAPLLYGLSLLVVFLFLAALYESWSIPLAVLLIVPLGLVGAIAAVSLRGLTNDIYLQIGLLTTMGLASKNAILMIEFAEQAERRGLRVIEAALEAARLRLRPILMTSIAFVFGVLPLALSTGAGANSRIAIGTAVVGGMLTATALAIFFIPLFFVMVRRGRRDMMSALRHALARRRERRAQA